VNLALVPNVIALSIQISCIAAVAGAVYAVLRITAPGLRYGFWRSVLALCLALPWLQTPREAVTRVDPLATGERLAAPVVASSNGSITAVSLDWTLLLPVIIGAGMCLRLAWIATGFARLQRLRASGEVVPMSEHASLQTTIGTRADVRYASTVHQPVTFGVFRPVVLLPESLRHQGTTTRDAVLAHELVHVRRRDWCWVVVEELLRAIFWFHPAFWWLISRVQHSREEIVDAAAIAITGRRREYLEALLTFADDVPLAPVPAFARHRHLFHRIVLLSTEDVMSARRIVASALVLAVVVAAAGWSAVRAFPFQAVGGGVLQAGVGPLEQAARPITPDNPIPTRVHDVTPVYPPEAAGENAAVTVTLRTVIDHNGQVAELRLGGFAFHLHGFSATLSGGPDAMTQFEQLLEKASFRASPGSPVVGGHTLRPLLQAFIESASTAVQQWRYEPPRDGPIAFDTIVSFTPGGKPVVTRTVVPAARGPLEDGAVRVGGNIKPPPKIKDVRPVYPPEARDARVQGVVIIEARIEPDGRVGSANVLRSVPLLDQAALDAVRQWEFMPTLLNGEPVPVIMTVTVQFTMQ